MSDETDEELEVATAGTLSFIDVVSCGLAAALLLFLVYTVLPHIGRSGSIRASITSIYAPTGSERNVAGLAKDEKSVTQAITVMSVTVDVAPVGKNALAEWKDLPRDCQQYVLRSKRRWMFVATCLEGIPPDDTITLALLESTRDARAMAVTASLFVGGDKELVPDSRLEESETQLLAKFRPAAANHLLKTHADVKAQKKAN